MSLVGCDTQSVEEALLGREGTLQSSGRVSGVVENFRPETKGRKAKTLFPVGCDTWEIEAFAVREERSKDPLCVCAKCVCVLI